VIRGVLLGVMMLSALPARADDVVAYQAEGDAAAAGADPRVAALDDAFSRAVTAAVADVVPGDARTAHKGDLDREIIGHARLWVASFTVTRDEVNDERRQLVVSVRIDRDKIRARLAKLGVATSDGTPVAVEAAPSARPIAIALRDATPHGIRADYGDNADKDTPGLASLTTALRNSGFAVRRAPSSGGAVHPDGELPLSDDEAVALAGEAKAELVLIAGVTVGDATPARGQAKPVALVTAHVRLLDKGKPVGQGSAVAAALGEDGMIYAVDRALAGALADVLPPAPKKLAQAGSYQGDDAPVAEPGVVLVRLAGKTPWHTVLDEQKYLAGAKGVHAATLRRVSPRGWVIGVQTGEPIERVAQIAKRAPATDTSADVKIVGSVVEVTLSGAP
jgi:hypothetical protein